MRGVNVGLVFLVVVQLLLGACASRDRQAVTAHLPGFETTPHWGEQVLATTLQEDVRVLINAPSHATINRALPTRLIVYALPNGNTIEWTAGKRLQEGDDWHFDIQHIAAQARRLREVVTDETIVVAYLEAKGLSWPTWRRENPDSGQRIVALLDEIRDLANPGGGETRIFLTGHSGGGSLTFGYLNAVDSIASDIDRIAFLDSNYGYAAEDNHGEKFIAWLQGDARRALIVIAYDDREIELDGRKVVGPTGGTWRATHRMFEDFRNRRILIREFSGGELNDGDFHVFRAINDQFTAYLHTNPENSILHTVLVGEMNGLLHAATLGTPWEKKWGAFGGPRAYEDWVQEAE